MLGEAYVGKIVLYVHPRMPERPPAIVTRVSPDGRLVNATVFRDGGRTFPVYDVPAGVGSWPDTSGPHWINTEGDQDG
jgi:hypothetical protein